MTTLDWSDRSHWGLGRALPCRYCGEWTPLLDNAERPAHKACAEAEIDRLTRLRRADH